MKRIISCICLPFVTLLVACKPPTTNDVIGTWVNLDGAQLILDENGQFFAQSLPQAFFFPLDKKVGSLVNGKGFWELQRGQGYWEVLLSFREMADYSASYGASVLISGNGDSMYLFQWKNEEGGNRYKLKRKSLAATSKSEGGNESEVRR